jgi:uncharacterized lipoprotein YbaY
VNRKSAGALLLATGLIVAACDGGTPATPSPAPTPAATPTAAPVATVAAATSVTGSLLLPEGASLPAGSSVVVSILDQSSADADVVMAEQVIPASEAGPSPIAFAVEYDPATIVADDPYVIGAHVIDEEDNLIFTAFEPVVVITSGSPTEGISLALVAVGA